MRLQVRDQLMSQQAAASRAAGTAAAAAAVWYRADRLCRPFTLAGSLQTMVRDVGSAVSCSKSCLGTHFVVQDHNTDAFVLTKCAALVMGA